MSPRSRHLVVVLPAVAALASGLYHLGRPSFWRDEAATVEMARRPLGGTLATLGDVDLVHGLYYLLMHPVVALLGTSETAVRLPSALAGVVTTALTAVLGRRLAGDRAGLIAGLLTAVAFPTLTRYSQEGRSYAWVTALALVSIYLFQRALDRRGRADFAWYGLSVALLGCLHLFALFLISAHLVSLWPVRDDRVLLRRWAVAVGCALVAVAPLAIAAAGQSTQVDWITKPTPGDVWDLLTQLAGAQWSVLVVGLVIAWALVARPPGGWLLVPWLVVPPVLLIGLSEIHPFYLFRYLLYCIPAVALLVAVGLARIPLWAAVAVTLGLVLLAVPGQREIRESTARADDLRRLASIIARNRQPGDGLVFSLPVRREITYVYPDAYRGLDDVAQDQTPEQADNLWGTEVDAAAFAARLAKVRRVWYVNNAPARPGGSGPLLSVKQRLIRTSGRFRLVHYWRVKGSGLYLYARG